MGLYNLRPRKRLNFRKLSGNKSKLKFTKFTHIFNSLRRYICLLGPLTEMNKTLMNIMGVIYSKMNVVIYEVIDLTSWLTKVCFKL